MNERMRFVLLKQTATRVPTMWERATCRWKHRTERSLNRNSNELKGESVPKCVGNEKKRMGEWEGWNVEE